MIEDTIEQARRFGKGSQSPQRFAMLLPRHRAIIAELQWRQDLRQQADRYMQPMSPASYPAVLSMLNTVLTADTRHNRAQIYFAKRLAECIQTRIQEARERSNA